MIDCGDLFTVEMLDEKYNENDNEIYIKPINSLSKKFMLNNRQLIKPKKTISTAEKS